MKNSFFLNRIYVSFLYPFFFGEMCKLVNQLNEKKINHPHKNRSTELLFIS